MKAGVPTVALFLHRIAEPVRELTGIGRYAVELSRALVTRGNFHYVLVTPRGTDPVPGTWPDIPIVRVGSQRQVLQLRWALLGRPLLEFWAGEVDLVHSLSPAMPVATRAPLVTTVHDLFPLDQPRWKRRRSRWLFLRAVEQAQGADHLITPSAHVAGQIARRLGTAADRLTVIPEAVDGRFATAKPDPELLRSLGLSTDNYLLAVGRVTPRKNLSVVLDALAQLDEVERPSLVVVGPPGPDVEPLRRRVDDLGLHAFVHIVGYVPDPDLVALLAGARALVHPSLDEGFGLPVLEALASGTPVLASDTGAIRETLAGRGTLLSPTDVGAWATAITDSRDRPNRPTPVARTWTDAAADTEAVYRRLLRRHASPTLNRPDQAGWS